MKRTHTAVRRLIRDDTGQDLMEYALLMGLIAVGAIVAVTAVGTSIGGVLWGSIVTNVAAAF